MFIGDFKELEKGGLLPPTSGVMGLLMHPSASQTHILHYQYFLCTIVHKGQYTGQNGTEYTVCTTWNTIVYCVYNQQYDT